MLDAVVTVANVGGSRLIVADAAVVPSTVLVALRVTVCGLVMLVGAV